MFFSHLSGIFHILICANCLLSCYWMPLRKAQSSLLPPIQYLYTLIRSPWTFSSLGWTAPAFSAFPDAENVPVLSSSLWHSAGLAPVSPNLFYTREPKAGHSSADVSHQYWAERKDHLNKPAGNTTPNAAQYAVGLSRAHHLHTGTNLSSPEPYSSRFMLSNVLKAKICPFTAMLLLQSALLIENSLQVSATMKKGCKQHMMWIFSQQHTSPSRKTVYLTAKFTLHFPLLMMAVANLYHIHCCDIQSSQHINLAKAVSWNI